MDIRSLLNPPVIGAEQRPATPFATSPTPPHLFLEHSNTFDPPPIIIDTPLVYPSSKLHTRTAMSSRKGNVELSGEKKKKTTAATTTTKKSTLAFVEKNIDDFEVPLNYPPVESTASSEGILTREERRQMEATQQGFKMYPSSAQGNEQIIDFPKFVPFPGGEKRHANWREIGRDGFNVLHYTFVYPNDNANNTWEVMWDFELGLVRMTPFFKALNYSKTVPSKAINATEDFKEVTYSITGGAIAAQGYWVHFDCARELCKTFCWPIKEALVPIFGFEFIKECLPTSHPKFGRDFEIDPAHVDKAQNAHNNWKTLAASKKKTPADKKSQGTTSGSTRVAGDKQLRPRKEKSAVKADPSSEGEDEDEDDSDEAESFTGTESPPVSPKTMPAARGNSGWTSINQAPHKGKSRPSSSSSRTIKETSDPAEPATGRGKKRAANSPAPTAPPARRARSPTPSESDDEDIQLPPPSRRRNLSLLDAYEDAQQDEMEDGDENDEADDEQREKEHVARILLEFSRASVVFGAEDGGMLF